MFELGLSSSWRFQYSRPRASRRYTSCRCQKWRWGGQRLRIPSYPLWRLQRKVQNPRKAQTETKYYSIKQLTKLNLALIISTLSQHLLLGLQYSPLQVGWDHFTTAEDRKKQALVWVGVCTKLSSYSIQPVCERDKCVGIKDPAFKILMCI